MADVSKIKLPNNSEVNIKDYRIPGVDNTPTSGSDNVVTSDGIYNALREDNPLYTKTYTYKCAAANEAEGYIYFLNVHPESSEWAMPWQVHYTLTVDCPDSSESANVKYCDGEYDVYVGCAGSNVYYHIFNKFYSASYYPLHQHKLLYHNSEAKYNNKDTYPAKCGARILSAWAANTVTRKYTIKVYDLLNCTISFPENIETHGNVYNADNYAVADMNGTGTGLQETGDSNTANYYNYEYYVGYRIHSEETPLYRYKFVGFDNRNRLIPITITNQTNGTIINKTPCSIPMIVSRGMAFYNTTTAITDSTTPIGTGALYRDNSIVNGILSYNFNEAIGTTSNSSINTDVYLAGTYNYETDEFTLDTTDYTSYYATAKILSTESEYYDDFVEGKFYWWLGQCPISNNYFNFQNIHPLYYFNGTKLIEVHSQEFKNISDQLFVYAQSLNDLNTNKESISNKVTSISSTSTDTEYPSAKAVYNAIPNVSNFITKSVNDLTNYYLKSETYTQAEVNSLIGAINQFRYQIAASTSAVSSPASNVLYLIGPTGSGADKYEEYVYANNTWVKIGDTSIDLSDYATKDFVEGKGYVTTDTKNTAGSTDTSSKIFLIGATTQAANPQTYSDNEVYATSGVLTTKSVQVGGTSATMQYNSTDNSIEFVFS